MKGMNEPITLSDAASLMSLDVLLSEQVPGIATLALEEGLDSRTIRRLAGVTPRERISLVGELRVALAEVGVEIPEPRRAAELLARSVSAAILSGRVDPMEAARFLSSLSIKVPGHAHVLGPFIHADSEFEDRPAERDLFEKMVRSAAAEIVESLDR